MLRCLQKKDASAIALYNCSVVFRVLSCVLSPSNHLSPTSLYMLSVSLIISDVVTVEESGMDSPSSTKTDEHVSYTSLTFPCAWKTAAKILG